MVCLLVLYPTNSFYEENLICTSFLNPNPKHNLEYQQQHHRITLIFSPFVCVEPEVASKHALWTKNTEV